MTQNRPTPITDAALIRDVKHSNTDGDSVYSDCVEADIARDLELKLADALESKDRISKRAEAIRCELVEMEKKFHKSESWRIEIFKQEQSSTNCAMFLRQQLAEAREENAKLHKVIGNAAAIYDAASERRDRLAEALKTILERFMPCRDKYIFSKRDALDKGAKALATVEGKQP